MLEKEEVVEREEETKEEEKVEKVISEKDGKVIASVPEDFEIDEDLEEEETEEEESEEEEKEEKEEKIAEDETEEEEVKEKYQGKSVEELIQMVDDRDVTIGKQGTKIQKFEETDPEKLSKEELKGKLTSSDLREAVLTNKKDIRAASLKLSEMSIDIDGQSNMNDAQEKLDKLQEAQDALELDLTHKVSDETINKKFASQENTKFLAEKKVEFKEKLGIKGEEFDSIVEASRGYVNDDGIITLNTLGKGMIDLKNYEGVAKLHEISGNEKARKEIVKAIKKGEKKISTTAKGGKRKTIFVTDDMSMHDTKRIVSNMTDDELFEK